MFRFIGVEGRRAVCSAALLIASGLSALTLTRGPYIGRPDDSTVAVVWTTDSPGDSRVEYALAGDPWLAVHDPASVTRHVVGLPGLAPGALYRYRVFSDGVALGEEATLRAPRGPAESRFAFGVIGDTDGGEIPRALAERLLERGADFAIHTGDVVYPAGAESDYNPKFFQPFARWLRHRPILPTLGNHDVRTERGAPYLRNFVLPANDATGSSRFYAFRHANALFVCLDVESSAFGSGSPQYGWLVRTLRDSDAAWKFVYFHEPPYSSRRPNRVIRLILSPLFERYGVDVVFCGHEHLYERTFPIAEFVPGVRGVVYITQGGGGAPLHPFHRESYSAYVSSRFGFVLGEIDGDTLVLTASEPSGAAFDVAVLQKPLAQTPRDRLRPIRAGDRKPPLAIPRR
ncbi:MAG: metallophosphoesterase [Thermoanaerobaculia bacterium]